MILLPAPKQPLLLTGRTTNDLEREFTLINAQDSFKKIMEVFDETLTIHFETVADIPCPI